MPSKINSQPKAMCTEKYNSCSIYLINVMQVLFRSMATISAADLPDATNQHD